jgi:Domain of unknown function (DUF4386)
MNMKDLQKIGGVAALLEAATFVVGFALYFTLLASANYGSLAIDPLENVAFLVENQAMMYAWNLIIYVAFGVFLVVLAQALYERLKVGSPALAQIATAFGLIWAGLVIASGMVANIGASTIVSLYEKDPAQAASVWLTLQFVVNGLGGGNEIVGGLWVLLISWAALRMGGLPRALNYLGVVVSVAGLLTVIPVLGDLGAIFGLGTIVWFAWLGIVMLRGSPGMTQPLTTR